MLNQLVDILIKERDVAEDKFEEKKHKQQNKKDTGDKRYNWIQWPKNNNRINKLS